MAELLNTLPAFALLADDTLPTGMGSIPALAMFMIVLCIVAVLMVIAVQKRSWRGGALILFFWLGAGLLTRPWALFNESPVILADSFSIPCWRIAAIIWALSILLGIVVLFSIRRRKSRRRGRRRDDDDSYLA